MTATGGDTLRGKTSAKDLRRGNRSSLLSRLYFDGPASRLDLSRATGLSTATVSNLTAELVAEGLVEEAGSIESDGGRPRVLLRVAERFGYVIGVDVGETRVRVELFDLTMNALAKTDFRIQSARPRPATIVKHILAGIDEVVEQAGVSHPHVLGVGIGVFGLVEQGDEAVVHAQTVGWHAVALEALLRAETDLPLHIDNGAKTLGQAEMWFGVGRGARHAVIALVGSGVGAAIVTNGELYRGASSSAGEWGHTTIVYGGQECRCGARGCLEAYVGASGILARYRAVGRGRGHTADNEESALADLLAVADSSRTADRVLQETAGYLGAGIADLVNLFNPERVVLGGWAGLALGPRLLPAIRSAVSAHALRQPAAQVSVELCKLGQDAVALGAATLPVARLLAEGGRLPR